MALGLPLAQQPHQRPPNVRRDPLSPLPRLVHHRARIPATISNAGPPSHPFVSQGPRGHRLDAAPPRQPDSRRAGPPHTQDGATRFRLSSDRSPNHPVHVELSRSCPIGTATPIVPRTPGGPSSEPEQHRPAVRGHDARHLSGRLCELSVRLRARGAHCAMAQLQFVVGFVQAAAAIGRATATRCTARPMTHAVAQGADQLADPDRRIGIGVAGLALSGLAVRERSIGRREAAVFRAVNGLPDELFVPAWVVMQAGTLAAGPVAGAVAWACGRPRLAGELALGGVGSWALSKPSSGSIAGPARARSSRAYEPAGGKRPGWGTSPDTRVSVALGVAAFGELSRAGRIAILVAVRRSACAASTSAHTCRSTSSAERRWAWPSRPSSPAYSANQPVRAACLPDRLCCAVGRPSGCGRGGRRA